MNKIQQKISSAGNFIGEVRGELKKCSWPSRSELVESTIMVIVSVVMVALFVGASDIVLMGFLRMIIR